jgi:hypothetical protein
MVHFSIYMDLHVQMYIVLSSINIAVQLIFDFIINKNLKKGKKHFKVQFHLFKYNKIT